MTQKLGIFLNLQMFAICRLIISPPIYHTFETKLHVRNPDIKPKQYIYYVYISGVYKDPKRCCQIEEQKKWPQKCQGFFYNAKLAT